MIKKNICSKKSVKAWILVFAVWFVFAFAGCSATKKIVEKKEMNRIDAFIEETSKYTPGVFNDYEYSSEFWDIHFNFDDNYIPVSVSELESQAEQL